MYDSSKLLPKSQFQQLVALLPTPRWKRNGRKPSNKEALVTGILQVLVNGVAWKKIADCGCSYASCFRYLQEMQRRGKLKLIYQRLAWDKTVLLVGSIDTTLIGSFAFRLLTGWNGQHKQMGTKVSLFVGKDGLSADVQFGKGNLNDKAFLLDHLKNTAGKRKKIINLDMSYMSLALRRAMRQKGIRINMKTRAQDFRRKRGRKFKLDEPIYNLRMEVERTNSWVKSFRALRLRRSPHPAMFKAFVYLALIIVLLRHSRFCNR